MQNVNTPAAIAVLQGAFILHQWGPPQTLAPSAMLASVQYVADWLLCMQSDNTLAAITVGQEALMLHQCAHENVVPLKFLGLRHPAVPEQPPDPTLVEYFGMPIADMTLEKLVG